MEKTLNQLYFRLLNLNYAPLPAEYPVMPLFPGCLQPAAYTQGDAGLLYVTILIPVFEQQLLILPEFIDMITMTTLNGTVYSFQCSLQVENDTTIRPSSRLAMVGFSVTLPQDLDQYASREIAVFVHDPGSDPADGDVGKVVMDANMIPTKP